MYYSAAYPGIYIASTEDRGKTWTRSHSVIGWVWRDPAHMAGPLAYGPIAMTAHGPMESRYGYWFGDVLQLSDMGEDLMVEPPPRVADAGSEIEF